MRHRLRALTPAGRIGSRPMWRSCRSCCDAKKQQAHPTSAPSGPFVADEVLTIVVLWVCWTACTFHAVPHAASDERCVAPHAAVGDPCAVPHAASPDLVAARRAVVGAVSWLVLEWWVLEWLWVLQRLALERLAVPEPRHLTALARWSAPRSPTRRLVREGKARLDARYFFHSYLTSGFLVLPRNTY